MSGKDWEDLLLWIFWAICYITPIAVAWWLSGDDEEPYRELTFDEVLASHPELDELADLYPTD